jgi:hypothetical protein
MFADDVANCAETVSKLQQQLNVIDTFCYNTGMEINLDKTEVIVFICLGRQTKQIMVAKFQSLMLLIAIA